MKHSSSEDMDIKTKDTMIREAHMCRQLSGGNPPLATWLVAEKEANFKERLECVGNVVIPQCANLAAHILAHAERHETAWTLRLINSLTLQMFESLQFETLILSDQCNNKKLDCQLMVRSAVSCLWFEAISQCNGNSINWWWDPVAIIMSLPAGTTSGLPDMCCTMMCRGFSCSTKFIGPVVV